MAPDWESAAAPGFCSILIAHECQKLKSQVLPLFTHGAVGEARQ